MNPSPRIQLAASSHESVFLLNNLDAGNEFALNNRIRDLKGIPSDGDPRRFRNHENHNQNRCAQTRPQANRLINWQKRQPNSWEDA